MAVEIRPATPVDTPELVALMTGFYAEADLALPTEPAERAFQTLLADACLGGVWLAEIGRAAVGYAVLTVCFSMEYGGLRGFIDDLYVRYGARRRAPVRGCWAPCERQLTSGASARYTWRWVPTIRRRGESMLGPVTPRAATCS
jgi:hypothetical protein